MTSEIAPPPEVQGMKILNRDAFQREIYVPYLQVPVEKVRDVIKLLKPCFLKLPNLQPVQEIGNERKILLHPQLFDERLLYLQNTLNDLNVYTVPFTKLSLKYENWSSDSIFKAVLPPDSTGNVSGFSIIGHIIHLNLKPDVMEFKHLIGQVFLDKFSNIKTVVNKSHIIEKEYRNFEMELLAGESNYEVTVKENGCQYMFDFSKVFWNPRLVREHEEIVKKINSNDLVFDVFAGVGPFAVPAAKKKCQVYANDLNPDSFKWLCHNAEINKVASYIHPSNLDGRDFIKTVVKDRLINFWNEGEIKHAHIIMNLPASALEFLNAFKGLFTSEELQNVKEMPIIYCHFFKRKDESDSDIIDEYLDEDCQRTLQVTPVRVVSPNKLMMRIEFNIPRKTLQLEDNLCSEPLAKKLKCTEE